MIDAKALTTLAPKLQNADDWAAGLQKTFDKFAIDTPKRVAAFLAQTIFESNYFTELAENLNYSEQGLLKTFPTHFNPEQAANYAHKPEQIANRGLRQSQRQRPGNVRQRLELSRPRHDPVDFQGQLPELRQRDRHEPHERAGVPGNRRGRLHERRLVWSWYTASMRSPTPTSSPISTIRINGGTNGLDDRKALWAKVQPLAEA